MSTLKKLLVFVLNRTEFILLTLVVILVIFWVSSLLNSSNDVANGGANNVIVYGLPFNIPDGNTGGNHHSFINGEYVELNDTGWAIEITVSAYKNFKESKYIISSYSKTINCK